MCKLDCQVLWQPCFHIKGSVFLINIKIKYFTAYSQPQTIVLIPVR